MIFYFFEKRAKAKRNPKRRHEKWREKKLVPIKKKSCTTPQKKKGKSKPF